MERKSIFGLILFTIAYFTSSSCQTVKYGHPGTKVEKEIVGKVYDKNGVKFSHPKDWQIVEDTITENKTILIMINADDADWKVADKEFQFILDSLKFE